MSATKPDQLTVTDHYWDNDNETHSSPFLYNGICAIFVET